MEGPVLDPVLTGRAGTRVGWSEVPAAVRSGLEARLGSPVASAATAEMGFSPALAARLRLVDGREVFVKAIGPDDITGAPGGQESYRREARISPQLPAGVPAPRLLSWWEDAGWVVLAFQAVDGRPPLLPWRPDELDQVLDGLGGLAAALSPAPFEAPAVTLPGGYHWAAIQAVPGPLDELDWVDSWVRKDLDRLAEVEADFDQAVAGETLAHTDIRADNVLIAADGVVFVDWPHVGVGAAWTDLLFFLPSVAMQGGPEPNAIFWDHPVARGADPAAVTAVLAGIAGYFVHGATQPAPAGLPTLRRFQAAQGQQALRWLRQLMG